MASVAASSESATAHSTERRIEIELAGGRRVIVDTGVDVEALRRVIEALDRRPTGVRVWLATGHTDMRKGLASLSLQVQEVLRRDPLSVICSASVGAEAIC